MRVPGKDFDTLRAARNLLPLGIWSDGNTMWVADSIYEKVYAYDMATKARVPGREFNTLEAAGNWIPRGIWSDGGTMWVADREDDKIYGYYMPQVEYDADREALVALYNATGSGQWINNTNWLTNAPVGQWHGVTTDANGRVTRLDLSRNGLTGEIPSGLGSLTNLDRLYLYGNQLTGEIPASLGRLANLQVLYLWGNQLTGQIPSSLGSLANLRGLLLDGNQLTGEIPSSLGSLANLQVLWLGGNQLTGEIPSSLGSLANLQVLYLDGNQLTGQIPRELGNLANLQRLYLYSNRLTGVLPSNFTQLTALEQFAFGDNSGLCAPTDESFQNWLTAIPNNDLPQGVTPLGPNCSPTDHAALVALYNATDGPNWANNDNWLSDRPLGEWHGVATDAKRAGDRTEPQSK